MSIFIEKIKKIQQITIELGLALKNKQLTLCTAESCTAGGLAYWITSVPGSSAWFERGFVVYSNEAKKDLLNVSANTLHQFGAVSEETAREMAKGALKNSLATISIATTGIAGPDGGSEEKPVGTVWTAFANKNAPTQNQTQTMVNIFHGDREMIRLATIENALEQLLLFIS
jgi:nicotinamide-nucleotide amidase